MSLEVARVVHEVGVGSSPVSRVDRASSVLNVIGDGGIVSRPEPQIDLVCSPFGGVPIREYIPNAWSAMVHLSEVEECWAYHPPPLALNEGP